MTNTSSQILLEMAIGIIVVLLQVYFFAKTLKGINVLFELLPYENLDESFIESSNTEKTSPKLIKIDVVHFSSEFREILNSINKYLTKNHGTADFEIIKSIVDRSIDSAESVVSSNITLPLYIGLMGTFTGIIIGLFKIAFFGGVTDNNINAFIGGVVIAMISSFLGLCLTVINNAKNFKDAKSICDVRKNHLYNFLQTELLPYLGNSLYSALTGLKENINSFNSVFDRNIKLFDKTFSANIDSLKKSVEGLTSNIGQIIESTKTQKAFLEEIKKTDYNTIAEANLKVFNIIKETIPDIKELMAEGKSLTEYTKNVIYLVNNLDSILNRIKSFEEAINNLGKNIDSKEYLSNEIVKRVDKNLSLLDLNFELLKRHEISSTEATQKYFDAKHASIVKFVDNIAREVEDALNFNIENNPFLKLNLLDSFEKQLNEINSKLNFQTDIKTISLELTSTRSEIIALNRRIISTLEKRKGNREFASQPDDQRFGLDNNEDENGNKKGVFKRLTNFFNSNRGR